MLYTLHVQVEGGLSSTVYTEGWGWEWDYNRSIVYSSVFTFQIDDISIGSIFNKCFIKGVNFKIQ